MLTVVAALMTAFYSWRLIFMTFHGAPRAPAEVMEHVHESPPVMLVPLYVLAAGALFAGLDLRRHLHRRGRRRVLEEALIAGEHAPILEAMHQRRSG